LPAPEGALPFDLDEHNAGGEVLMAGDDEGSFGIVKIADERITAVAERWATAEEWIGTWEPNELDPTVEGSAIWHGK
jgi:hypothetical protein